MTLLGVRTVSNMAYLDWQDVEGHIEPSSVAVAVHLVRSSGPSSVEELIAR